MSSNSQMRELEPLSILTESTSGSFHFKKSGDQNNKFLLVRKMDVSNIISNNRATEIATCWSSLPSEFFKTLANLF